MKCYRIALARSEGWYSARAVDDPSVITQGRTLDEVMVNVREVLALLYDEHHAQVELILPPDLEAPAPGGRRAS